MKKLKVGITGQKGFIGSYLYNTLSIHAGEFERVEFKTEFFNVEANLDSFISQCDIIVHLAAMNRHHEPELIYQTNINLVNRLIGSLKRVKSKAHVIMSSSSQEERDNLYGKSKKEGRELLCKWAEEVGAKFTGIIIPNVYGPFGKPFYNSVVATFSHQIARGESPKIEIDGELKLVYVGELVDVIVNKIREGAHEPVYVLQHTTEAKVSHILTLLEQFKEQYQNKGEIPLLDSNFKMNLFNTYRSYMDLKTHFPVRFIQHTDTRGSFVEIIRLGIGGQVSFSTTAPGVVRGNHFHTRKIERFAVIKGKALVQLRKIGTNEILDFYLDGNTPAYVDMPIWYAHSIKNIGTDTLYTNFWINEPYDPQNTDTYFENV